MKAGAAPEELARVIEVIRSNGLEVHLSHGQERTIVGLVGDVRRVSEDSLASLDGVEKVIRVLKPFKLASRDFYPESHIVHVGSVAFGGGEVPVIAGPCAIENEESAITVARLVRDAGARMFRGGAFKPRTSPYSFQGLGEEGLRILARVRELTGLPVVSEVISPQDVSLVSSYVDMLQIGARNMHNYALLHEVGKANRPVLLKRGLMSSVEEWLMAAEYILLEGNSDVVLCERGIRTYETVTRNTLDLSAVAAAKHLTHLPVIVDPSHGTGRWDLVAPMARAAVACGADGIIVEVHPRPEAALSDGPQSLKPEVFADMMCGLRSVARAVGRTVADPADGGKGFPGSVSGGGAVVGAECAE
jgi:3-deoxy-7-phosphoheptulonate synthase